MSSEEIAGRIRNQLETRGIRLEDVIRDAQEQRGKSIRQTATGTSVEPNALSDVDQATVNRIVNVFNRVYKVYSDLGVLDSAPVLYYATDPTINAFAREGSQVVIYLALAELLQDSDNEFSQVVAHELGHIVQQRYNRLVFVYDTVNSMLTCGGV